MQIVSSEKAKTYISNSTKKRIAVLGDIMVDTYYWGSVSRVSPEAPVPVVDVERETSHLGGAANVANNIKTLGAEPILYGVIGNDEAGQVTIELLQNAQLSTEGIFKEPSRPTTVKTRIIGNNQQIVRLDKEVKTPISVLSEQQILASLEADNNLAAIVFEDYNKGMITESLIMSVMKFANEKKIPVLVDPKKDNFFAFKNGTIFKPNKKEAEQALGYSLHTDADIEKAGIELLKRLQSQYILLTLGEKGMMLFDSKGAISSVETKAKQISDVSGAGDTVIATLTVLLVGGASVSEAAFIANFAASIACSKSGIVSVTTEELLNQLAT
jgi:rfaE bifunctional protein kinase chain/domain